MIHKHFIAASLALALGFADIATVAAQTTPRDDARGNAAPGTATDGSRPADGAIQGGSILPGERGGMPDTRGTTTPDAKTLDRCEELTGTLREQCMLQAQGASTGGSRMPDTRLPGDRDAPVRIGPPPANPR